MLLRLNVWPSWVVLNFLQHHSHFGIKICFSFNASEFWYDVSENRIYCCSLRTGDFYFLPSSWSEGNRELKMRTFSTRRRREDRLGLGGSWTAHAISNIPAVALTSATSVYGFCRRSENVSIYTASSFLYSSYLFFSVSLLAQTTWGCAKQL